MDPGNHSPREAFTEPQGSLAGARVLGVSNHQGPTVPTPSCFLLKPLLDQLLPVGSPGQSGRAGCTQLLRRHDNRRWR